MAAAGLSWQCLCEPIDENSICSPWIAVVHCIYSLIHNSHVMFHSTCRTSYMWNWFSLLITLIVGAPWKTEKSVTKPHHTVNTDGKGSLLVLFRACVLSLDNSSSIRFPFSDEYKLSFFKRRFTLPFFSTLLSVYLITFLRSSL